MRVLFNGITLLKPKTGIAHAATNLHAALTASFPEDTFWLYPGEVASRCARRFFATPLATSESPTGPSRKSFVKRLAAKATRAIGRLGYTAHFRSAARIGRFDLYHEPNFVPFRTNLPLVVSVFDLSVLLYPQWHPAERVQAHESAFARGIAQAAHVLVGTQAVRAEAMHHLGLAPDRVTAMLCGVGPQFRPQPANVLAAVRSKYGLPDRYTLYVGTIEPRKNVATLLRAFCDLPTVARAACPLVLAGGWGWKAESERELFNSEARHKGVLHIGYVPDSDLPALYSAAEALLYPTFYEGFGMPPIEAMACGTAAVTSTASAVREVVGRAALMLDPHDLASWRDVLGRISADAHCLDEYRHRGPAHAAAFTWEACAHTVHGVYRTVLGLPQPGKISIPRAA